MTRAGHPRYSRLTATGHQWLGHVPSGWKTARLKNLFQIRKHIAGKLGFEVLSVTQRGVKLKDLASGDGQLSMDYSKYQLVFKNDFVMNHMDLLTGFVDISSFSGVTSPDYRVFVPRMPSAMHPRFFLYIFQLCYLNKIFFPLGQGSAQLGRWRLPRQEFETFILPVPSREEQTQVAQFLDYETGRIDALIEKQRQLIALLEEKRQAVINHAVTKGLNPNAPLRDSGVEWLGMVPAHWEIKKLRYFATVLRGKFTHRPRNDPAFYDGRFPFVQTGDITGASKYITTYKQTLNDKGASVSKQFPRGTLVMAIAANIGDVAILDFPAYFPDSVVGLRPNTTSHVMFLYYMMQAMKQPMLQRATISTQMNLNVDQIGWLPSACPPIVEQQRIAGYLDELLSRMSVLETKMAAKIEFLQERRTALISAAVTGKIDVRGWVPPESKVERDVA